MPRLQHCQPARRESVKELTFTTRMTWKRSKVRPRKDWAELSGGHAGRYLKSKKWNPCGRSSWRARPRASRLLPLSQWRGLLGSKLCRFRLALLRQGLQSSACKRLWAGNKLCCWVALKNALRWTQNCCEKSTGFWSWVQQLLAPDPRRYPSFGGKVEQGEARADGQKLHEAGQQRLQRVALKVHTPVWPQGQDQGFPAMAEQKQEPGQESRQGCCASKGCCAIYQARPSVFLERCVSSPLGGLGPGLLAFLFEASLSCFQRVNLFSCICLKHQSSHVSMMSFSVLPKEVDRLSWAKPTPLLKLRLLVFSCLRRSSFLLDIPSCLFSWTHLANLSLELLSLLSALFLVIVLYLGGFWFATAPGQPLVGAHVFQAISPQHVPVLQQSGLLALETRKTTFRCSFLTN